MTNFEKLLSLNVNDKTEKRKQGSTELTYLSWSFAWAEFKKVYEDAFYEVVKNPQGLPYFHDDSGAMCYTKVTAGGITHEMWLPVMDGANKAMKKEPYEYTTSYGKKKVEAYTMFDVNKTVMRCLVKNLAMFGLGLYIYSGEDLPEPVKEEPYDILKVLTEEQKRVLDNLIVETDSKSEVVYLTASSRKWDYKTVFDKLQDKLAKAS